MSIVYQLEDRRRLAGGYAGSVIATFTDLETAWTEFCVHLSLNPAFYGPRSGHQLVLIPALRQRAA